MLVAYMPVNPSDKTQKFLKKIFEFYYLKTIKQNFVMSCEVQVVNTFNPWEKSPYIFAIYKHIEENTFSR